MADTTQHEVSVAQYSDNNIFNLATKGQNQFK